MVDASCNVYTEYSHRHLIHLTHRDMDTDIYTPTRVIGSKIANDHTLDGPSRVTQANKRGYIDSLTHAFESRVLLALSNDRCKQHTIQKVADLTFTDGSVKRKE